MVIGQDFFWYIISNLREFGVTKHVFAFCYSNKLHYAK